MLSQIIKNISKWMGNNVYKQHKECIPPSSEHEMSELNKKSAQEMDCLHSLGKHDTLSITK